MSTEMSKEDPQLGSKRPREETEIPQDQPVLQRQNTGRDAIDVARQQSDQAKAKEEARKAAKKHAREAEEERLMHLKGIKIVQENTSYAGCLVSLLRDRFQEGKYNLLLKHMSEYVGLEFDVQELGLLPTTTLEFSCENGKLKGTGMVQILNKEGVPGGAIQMALSTQVGKHFTFEQAEELKTKFALILVPIYYESVKSNGVWVIDTTKEVKKDFHLCFGGKNKANESPYDTIVRELNEETGVNCNSNTVEWSMSKESQYWYNPSSNLSTWEEPFSKLSHKPTTEMWNNSMGRRFDAPVHIVSTVLDLVAISSSPPNVIRVERSNEPGIFIPKPRQV